MRPLLLFLLLSFCFSSCSEDEIEPPVCTFDDPAEDLPWLKEILDGFNTPPNEFSKYFYVAKGTYNNGAVFSIQNCCPICNMTPPKVYDCEGEVINTEVANVSDWAVVWRAPDFACTI